MAEGGEPRGTSVRNLAHVGLAGLQSDQSLIAVVGDGDNSSSSRWVKFASRASMNHAAGIGAGWHAITVGGAVGEED